MNLPQPVLSFAANAALRMPPAVKPIVHGVLALAGMRWATRFMDYVIDFERAYITDDWSRVAEYFAPDAIYEVRHADFDCRLEGREAVLAGFRRILDRFDRQLHRDLRVVKGPYELPAGETDDGGLTFLWKGSYSRPAIHPAAADTPPVRLSARQSARYRDGLIVWLADEYRDGTGYTVDAWIEAHAPELSARYEEGT
ncbi:MAG: nuclear transport factor 2 family protein [Acidobacteriota bacterium]